MGVEFPPGPMMGAARGAFAQTPDPAKPGPKMPGFGG